MRSCLQPPPSGPVPMTSAVARNGVNAAGGSIRPGGSSSTRPGAGPVCQHCEDGRRAGSGSRLMCRMVSGRPDLPSCIAPDRVTAPWPIDGPINGKCFRTYIERAPCGRGHRDFGQSGLAQGPSSTHGHPRRQRAATASARPNSILPSCLKAQELQELDAFDLCFSGVRSALISAV